ncbi:9250_t:CDS:2 [Ambispora gerdemannii]|uniref:9250_t:CDS:1 n=1 Tax=Ambispora gerdemannii TaxID=144530 RepID=A0A9N9DNS0_9GLOM|nr:9250_t:CDS:2 [Ambispora gerdemannii]
MVSSQMIKNCWKKTGILSPEEIENFTELSEHDVWNSISDSSMNEEQKLQELINHLPANNYLTAHEYISIDDSKVEHGLTDEEILMTIADEDKEEEKSVDEQVEKVSCNEAESP